MKPAVVHAASHLKKSGKDMHGYYQLSSSPMVDVFFKAALWLVRAL